MQAASQMKQVVTLFVLVVFASNLPSSAQTCSRAAKIFEPRPIAVTKLDKCPLGYIKDAGYCIPYPNRGTVPFAIKSEQNKCPHQFTKSGSFCLSQSRNPNFVIAKRATSCPRGWVTQSNHFCVKTCPAFDLDTSRQLNSEVKLLRRLFD